MSNTITANGYLPGDIQVTYDQQGRARLNLRFSSQKSRKDDQGNWINEGAPIWIGVTLWGKDAEYYGERAVKGARIAASGQLVARTYMKDGLEKMAFEIEFPTIRLELPRDRSNYGNASNGGGWSADYGRQQANNRDMRGGTTSDDPWATGGNTGGGFGTGEEPF